MDKAIDMTGLKIGKWTVLSRAPNDTRNKAMWLCKCECGKEIAVSGRSLRTGRSLGCGHDHMEMMRNALSRKNDSHGKCKSIEYSSWLSMKSRCLNKNNVRYMDYGGRGIKICERWRNSFKNFHLDMGDRPGLNYSLDRINVNGDYEPENCRWADNVTQRRNRRDSRSPVNAC